jgi:hypothetical protein
VTIGPEEVYQASISTQRAGGMVGGSPVRAFV